MPFLLECARKCDILLIQEHWLFNCQRDALASALREWDNVTACTDDLNPVAQHCMPRGWGGVSILWRRKFGHMIQPIKTDSTRTVAIKIGNNTPTLLTNSYMPSGNGASKKIEYMTTLAHLQNLAESHGDSNLILAGDFNMDPFKDAYAADQRRKALLKMADDLHLQQVVPASTPTMYAHNGRDTSVIDLVFAADNNSCSTPIVEEKVTWNTSCHTPVTFTIKAQIKQEKPSKRKTQQRRMVIKKNSTIKSQFDDIMEAYLELFQTQLIHPHDAAQIIALLLKAATIQASTVAMSAPPTRKTIYPRSVIDALKKSRRVHAEWKDAGRPKLPHPKATARKASSRAVRSALRTCAAQKRENKYRAIMDSAFGDQRLFHSLVNEHKAKVQTTDTLIVDGKLISDPDTLRDCWADYYEELATPKNKPEWNDDKLAEAKATMACRIQVCKSSSRTTTVKAEDVTSAIKSLNKGKAADMDGIRAEHLKDPCDSLVEAMTAMFDGMLDVGVSEEMKTGKKIPIPKKSKDQKDMNNYRGILISSTFGKVFESLILQKNGNIPQSSLQFGFTAGLSPLMAAICLTEASCESRVQGKNLHVATLDTQKAFDVVSHPILMAELSKTQMPNDLWMAILDLYDGMSERILWEGDLSRPVKTRQGVGQGRILSPTLYKLYMEGVLRALRESGAGVYVGAEFLGSPTVADDVLLADQRPPGLQTLLHVAKNEADDRRYTIHPVKSESAAAKGPPCPMMLGDKEMPHVTALTHLGVTRNLQISNADIISDRISTAAGACYALMPSGLHGENGISPHASRKILVAYVLPRLLYGLEALIISKTELVNLDRAYKRLLKSLTSLRDGTADAAVYIMMGLLPAEAELHRRILSLYGNITRLKEEHPLRRLGLRQVALPSEKRYGWFGNVCAVAGIYGIEDSIMAAIISPWQKSEWKEMIGKAVNTHWVNCTKTEAEGKSSMKYMSPILDPRSAHHLWPRGGCASRKRVAASFRAKMLTGSYILQANRARFNQNSVDPTCPLCLSEPEDLPHFLLSCTKLSSTRNLYLPRIKRIASDLGIFLPEDYVSLCKNLLNAADPDACCACSGRSKRSRQEVRCKCSRMNELINQLCLDLHNDRTQVLSQTGKGKK